MSNKLIIGIVILVCLFIIGLILASTITRDVSGICSNKQWESYVYIEKYDWNHHSKESSSSISIPVGARNVHKWTSTHTNSDGERKTKYHVSYEIREWITSRTIKAFGDSTIEPYFEKFVLSQNPEERVANKQFKFIFSFNHEDKSKSYTTQDMNIYNIISIGNKYNLKVNLLGHITKILL